MNQNSSRMDSQLTSMWVNFFTAAGIPSDVAATYSLTFTENRIQLDMLLDLNKEYLKDMGITRMGDVIAILRHAKQVHESAARDRVLSSATTKVPVAAVTARLTAASVPSKSSSPASRILEHYTRNTTPESSPPRAPVAAGASLKRKGAVSVPDAVMEIKKSRLIRFGTKQAVAAAEVSKQTVFARLGNAETAKVSPAATQPGKPIFSRLGAKTDALTELAQDIPVPRDALRYEGILKPTPNQTSSKLMTVTTSKDVRKIAMKTASKVSCTMRADEPPLSVKEKLATKSVKFSNTVQYKEIDRIPKPALVAPKHGQVFNKPERRLTMPDGVKLDTNNGVKARLGSKDVNNLTITKNVFNRLGA